MPNLLTCMTPGVDCDLCVAPRDVNDNYERGHSIFKIGVFMIEGVPALAGPVPSYELLLGDRAGGHICKTIDEWFENIKKCLNERSILKEWSLKAIERANSFATDVIARQVANRLELLLRGRVRLNP